MATSRPSFILARWTCPMDAAAKGLSSNISSLSLQFGPRSLFRAFCRQISAVSVYTTINLHQLCMTTHVLEVSREHCVCNLTEAVVVCTVICLMGMKSALWRTRSKIFARWGLMKASSGEIKEIYMSCCFQMFSTVLMREVWRRILKSTLLTQVVKISADVMTTTYTSNCIWTCTGCLGQNLSFTDQENIFHGQSTDFWRTDLHVPHTFIHSVSSEWTTSLSLLSDVRIISVKFNHFFHLVLQKSAILANFGAPFLYNPFFSSKTFYF